MCQWPAVTCVCPTGGRWERLREALAFFEAQDYPGEARLLILNESPEAACARACATIVNTGPDTYATLGDKRQALLQLADAPIVAHWDDDDVYLPDHLTRSVRHLLDQGVQAVKARGAYFLCGPRRALQNKGVRHNVFEGTMVFYRQAALDVGGYPPLHSGQALALWRAFGTQRARLPLPPTYAYRWADGVGHISAVAAGHKGNAKAAYRARNQDYGSGLLTPAPIGDYYRAIGLDTDVR